MPDEHEAEGLLLAFDLHAADKYSDMDTATILNERVNYKTSVGGASPRTRYVISYKTAPTPVRCATRRPSDTPTAHAARRARLSGTKANTKR